MKYLKNIIKMMLVVILLFSVGSCTKNFEEMNKSPNSPVDVPAINIFTNSLVSAVGSEGGGWIQHTYLGCWSQQWCKVQYIDEDKYEPRNMSGTFDGPYSGNLKNLTIVINKAIEDEDDRLLAAAMIMKSWIFAFVTDIFGDIPMSEALQGFSADGIVKPVYDTQEDVYMAILADLEQANSLLTGTTINFGSGDVLYGGDPVMWRKLANSLKLRLLNRAAGTPWSFTYDMVDPQTDVTTTPGAAAYAGADAAIASILGNPTTYPIFTSNDDNARLVYPGLPYRNPIYNTLYSRTDQGISETMVDWLNARTDPRIHIYAQPVPMDLPGAINYKGFQNGSDQGAAPFPQVSLIGGPVAYDEFAPIYIMCYDEVEFIKAEHYLRQADDGMAQTAYEAGIAASMERWDCVDGGTVSASVKNGVSYDPVGTPFAVDYAAYLADPLVDWTVAASDAFKFQLICEQKWAAMFGQGVQAWHEVRRTGFPERTFTFELADAYYPDLGMPVRVQYSLNEETYNAVNLAAAKDRQNIQLINEGMFSNGDESQMWWHTRVNPIPTEKDHQVWVK